MPPRATGEPTTLEQVRRRVEALAARPSGLHGGDFLLTWRHDPAAIHVLVQVAQILEDLKRLGRPTRVFDSGLGVAIFRDKSTRTRYAFRAGNNLLGLATEELEESTSQIAHGETVRETAAMVSFLTEVIGVRDDMYLGEGHAYMAEIAASVDASYREGIIGQRPAVLNLQCDLDHPTQSLSDLSHLARVFGGLEALRGRKLAITWAHSPSYGKPLSVPQGIVALMTRFGMEVVLAHPPGYELVEEPLEAAHGFASESGGSFRVTDSMTEAFEGADVVYPKSWAPIEVMKERTQLLRSGATAELAELERRALEQNARHTDWECTERLMSQTKAPGALYMHCLPADVSEVSCSRGEVSRSVFEAARLDTYAQASHKPFVIAALVLATRVQNPAAALARCLADVT